MQLVPCRLASTSSIGSRSGIPAGSAPRGKDDLLGMAASASIRSARFGASSSESSSSSPRTPSRTLDRSSSTRGWSNQRNRMLRARSPTIGNRLGRLDQPVQQLSLVVGRGVDWRRLRDPVLQHARDEVDVGTGTPLGEVDPEDRLLELRVRSSSVTPYLASTAVSRSRKCSFSPCVRRPGSAGRCGSAPGSCARAARCAPPRRRGGCG